MMSAAIKRGSYKSKYAQAGPAPLASFEDLPSDEMESPNSLAEEDEEDSDPILSTVTINVENDVESQHTLTPCEGLCFHEGSLSSIATLTQQEATFVSADSASVENVFVPSPPVDSKVSPGEQYSKSSWTDILKSRSRSYSPQESPQVARKKEPKPNKEEKSAKKSKGGVLSSLLKFGEKKGTKSRSPESPAIVPAPETKFSPPTGDENFAVVECEQALFKSSGNKNRPNKIDLDNEIDKTPPSFSDHFDRNLQGNTSDEIPTVSEMESSDSEFPLDESDVRKEEEEEHDFEAETLLAQDSVDFDDGPGLESLTISTQNWSGTQPKTRSVRPRLEITTVPIDRPRSTTPISCAPLEAFIQSSTPSETNAEKIKVLLPGEQFTMKLKSPKKGYPKSWQDFCEAGLHSPRLPKRSSHDATPISPHTPGFDDNWASGSEQKWETFETSAEEFTFPDVESKNPSNPSMNGVE